MELKSTKLQYSEKDNETTWFNFGAISTIQEILPKIEKDSELYQKLEEHKDFSEEINSRIVEKYVKQHLEKGKTENYVNHEVPLLLPTRLHTEKEVRKILKEAGLNNFYNLKVLVTAGVEIQDLETMNKSTELYKGMKEAQENGELVYKFTLQPGQKL